MTAEPRAIRGRIDRRFYSFAAFAAAAIVFVGFARTYYLKVLYGGPELTGLVHVHGVVMTTWVLLFVAQVSLVAARRTDIHRRLGTFGAVWACVMVVVGATTAIVAAKKGVSPGPPPLVFLVIPLCDLVVFSGLVGAGVWFRKRPDAHRRIMLLAFLAILPAAVARIPVESIRTGGPLAFFGLTDLLILACVAFDTVRNRRLHPAFAWGASFVIASHPLRLMLGGTSAWMSFATWLVS